MTTDERVKEIRKAATKSAQNHPWVEYVTFLLAELDAARAREAKLREALKATPCPVEAAGHGACTEYMTRVTDMCRRCAALAGGEDTAKKAIAALAADAQSLGIYDADEVDAARAKDAEEIADLTRKLRVFLSFPCHWTRGEIEYTTDCGQVAFPVTSVPDGQCHGCGRPIVVSVVVEPHDVPAEERDRP